MAGSEPPPVIGASEQKMPLPSASSGAAELTVATSLPEISVPASIENTNAPFNASLTLGAPAIKFRGQPKSWQTKLAATVKPKNLRYNYKRVALPGTISRTHYSLDNRHLPKRFTRADYEGLLFMNIAKRDMEATRALLNAGTDIQAMNAYGETPRSFAERIGAADVAAMIAARGGR